MIRSIIKYLGIALIILGIFLVLRNLITKDNELTNKLNNNKNTTYDVTIKLLDENTKKQLSGSKLVLKNKNNELIAEWNTTTKAYSLTDLPKGEYTLIQITAPENYHIDKTGVMFEIKDKDREIVMYNKKMTEEEIKESNTTKSDVNVDNTASSKSIFTSIIATILVILGINKIYKTKESY